MKRGRGWHVDRLWLDGDNWIDKWWLGVVVGSHDSNGMDVQQTIRYIDILGICRSGGMVDAAVSKTVGS